MAWTVLGLCACEASEQPVSRPAVEERPSVVIGGGFNDPPEYSFVDIAAMVVVGDSLFVLDADAKEVRVFDSQGALLDRIGRAGAGPGEFEWPTDMRRVSEGIAVFDLRLRRRSTFSLTGDLRGTEELGQHGDQGLASSIRLRGATMVSETVVAASSDGGVYPERMILASRDGSAMTDTLARYSTGYVPYRDEGSFGFLTERVGSEGNWAVAGDSLLVIASGEPTRLQWWRAGEAGLSLAGELALPVQPVALTGDDSRSLVEAVNEERNAEGSTLLSRSTEFDFPRYWGQVGALVLAADGTCWIQWDRPRSEEDKEWFRVDLGAGGLEQVALPAGFHMLAADHAKLYGFQLDELDVPSVVVLRLLN